MQLTILLALLPLLAAPFTSARVLPRAGTNLQTFTGALGAAPTPIIDSGDAARPFSVKGNTFVNFGAAAQRSCDVQFNACANAANSGQAGLTVSACQTQQREFCSFSWVLTSARSSYLLLLPFQCICPILFLIFFLVVVFSLFSSSFLSLCLSLSLSFSRLFPPSSSRSFILRPLLQCHDVPFSSLPSSTPSLSRIKSRSHQS